MMDYKSLGLKVGLEIHQQLDTDKLFCRCPSELVEEKGAEVFRYLRPTSSELGEIDRAALAEAARSNKFLYQCPESTSCLVDMDEEPPGEPNECAMEVALKVALLLNSHVLPEIHFMRKMVIDGSNTTGFQRTGLLAVNGNIDVDGKTIGIPSICLEEDAARIIGENNGIKTYRLDRLGIPLMEIVTTPDMESPEEAKKVAQTIGGLLRATRKVKRGLGTIREDVNISIRRGARVEIKGVQDLGMLPEYVEKEVERQVRLLGVREKLIKRDAEVKTEIKDLTQIFKETSCEIIANNINKGKGVYGIKLKGFSGCLRGQKGEALLGPEMANYAKVVGIRGIFHSDELPKFGITVEDIEKVCSSLRIGKNDAFILVSEKQDKAEDGLEWVLKRARMALEGIPEETRNAQPDGTTAYSRPLSGGARMYPETDVPPYHICEERIRELGDDLPERPSERIKRYIGDYELNREQCIQLFRKGYDLIFEEIADEYGNASVVANMFLQVFPEIERESLDPSLISEATLKELFKALDSGKFAKEGIPEILKHLCKDEGLEDAMAKAGIEEVDLIDVRKKVVNILEERDDFIAKRGMGAIGPLMGVVMEEFRGKVDGKMLSNILKEELQKRV